MKCSRCRCPKPADDGYRTCLSCRQARQRKTAAPSVELSGDLPEFDIDLTEPPKPLGNVNKASSDKLAIPPPIKHSGHTGTLGCITTDDHHPHHNAPFWRAKLAWIRSEQPDEIVINGDFLEMISVSSHAKATPESFVELEQDLDVGRRALRELRDAAPGASITYLEGNHETMLTRYVAGNVAMAIQRSIGTLPEELQLDRLGVQWVPETKQPISIGTMDVLHGHQIPGKFLPKHHAAKVADLYGRPGHTVVIGHSHREQEFIRPSKFGNCRAICLGAGRDLDPKWMKGGPGGWGASWLVYHVRDGVTDAQHVRFERGGFYWGGCFYSGLREAT